MKELLDKMLFLAKSEQYEMESSSESFDLSELLVKNLLVMEPLAYERNLKIKTEKIAKYELKRVQRIEENIREIL